MMWEATFDPNWIRESKSAVRSISIPSPTSCDPFRMGEHLEPVVAGDAHKREAGRLGSAHRQSRRRRHPHYHPNHTSFLHELDGNPARQHNDALGSRRAPARCATVPSGTNAASEGSRLKLASVNSYTSS